MGLIGAIFGNKLSSAVEKQDENQVADLIARKNDFASLNEQETKRLFRNAFGGGNRNIVSMTLDPVLWKTKWSTAGNIAFDLAAEYGFVDMLPLILKAGVDLGKCDSAIEKAVTNGRTEFLARLDETAVDLAGRVSLKDAALYGHSFLIKKKIRQGTDLHKDQHIGNGALQSVVTSRHIKEIPVRNEIVEVLLKAGARANILTLGLRDNVLLAFYIKTGQSVVELLRDCDQLHSIDFLHKLAATDRNNVIAIHIAAMLLLANAGMYHHVAAIIRKTNPEKTEPTLLEYAVEHGYSEIAELLKKYGAKEVDRSEDAYKNAMAVAFEIQDAFLASSKEEQEDLLSKTNIAEFARLCKEENKSPKISSASESENAYREDVLAVKAGDYFKGSNDNWQELYGKCYERISNDLIRARIFTPRAKNGDNGTFPISWISSIISEDQFNREFQELCNRYYGNNV